MGVARSEYDVDVHNPLLAALGVRHYKSVLSRELVTSIARSMMAANGSASMVYTAAGEENVIDAVARRSLSLEIPEDVYQSLSDSFAVLEAEVVRDFGDTAVPPSGYEFLKYGPGDRFVAHSDVPSVAYNVSDPNLRSRVVSMVIFINGCDGPTDEPGYTGGRLLFRGANDDIDEFSARGFGIDQIAGDAVAFPSNLLHEVAPVESGTRLTVVGFFLNKPAQPASESSSEPESQP